MGMGIMGFDVFSLSLQRLLAVTKGGDDVRYLPPLRCGDVVTLGDGAFALQRQHEEDSSQYSVRSPVAFPLPWAKL